MEHNFDNDLEYQPRVAEKKSFQNELEKFVHHVHLKEACGNKCGSTK